VGNLRLMSVSARSLTRSRVGFHALPPAVAEGVARRHPPECACIGEEVWDVGWWRCSV
jgi:hypothetical protein